MGASLQTLWCVVRAVTGPWQLPDSNLPRFRSEAMQSRREVRLKCQQRECHCRREQ
jgi:hypothetical protein